MEIIFWIVATNILAIVVMYAIQHVEAASRVLPKRSKKFLYLQDWYTTTWGDVIGLSMFDAAIVPHVFGGTLSFQYVMFSFVFGFLFTTLCFAHFLAKNHRPDAGAPRVGELSANGLYHAVYFFFQASFGGYGAFLFATGNLSNAELVFAVLGVFTYTLCFMGDLKKFTSK